MEGPAPHGEPVGLIGLGLMGRAMAERLLGRGIEVWGFDIDTGCVAAFESEGGRAVGGVAELTCCSRVILSLPNSEVVQGVIEQLESHLRPSQIIVDTTTGGPDGAVAAARRLGERGVFYVEAMISGNSDQVRRGEVLIMASGGEEAVAQCEDLFACFASRVRQVGGSGNASKMKLVSNLVLGLNRAVLAEGLAFAERLGLNPEQTLAVLRESMGYSRVMDAKGHKMITGDFEPQARLSQHLKDVRLILRAAKASQARTPLSEVHEQLLQQAESQGLGGLDNSAIIRVFEREGRQRG